MQKNYFILLKQQMYYYTHTPATYAVFEWVAYL